MENVKKKREYWIDFARTFAIISIVFNHAVNRAYSTYYNTIQEFSAIPLAESIFKDLVLRFSRLGVPIFLMITGALLLKRNFEDKETLKKFFKHNYLQLLITTEIWLAIMFWFLQFLPNSKNAILDERGIVYTIIRFLGTLFFVRPISFDSIWYMECILCIFPVIPFLSIAVKRINFKYILLPFSLIVFCGMLLPDLNALASAIEKRSLPWESYLIFHEESYIYFVYVICGYYIGQGLLSKISAKALITLFVIFFLGGTALQIWIDSSPFDYNIGYPSFILLIPSVCLFELFRRKAVPTQYQVRKFVERIANYAFGIYFVHIIIMQSFTFLFNHFDIIQIKIAKLCFYGIFSLLLSFLIIYVTSKSKVLKRYLWRM